MATNVETLGGRSDARLIRGVHPASAGRGWFLGSLRLQDPRGNGCAREIVRDSDLFRWRARRSWCTGTETSPNCRANPSHEPQRQSEPDQPARQYGDGMVYAEHRRPVPRSDLSLGLRPRPFREAGGPQLGAISTPQGKWRPPRGNLKAASVVSGVEQRVENMPGRRRSSGAPGLGACSRGRPWEAECAVNARPTGREFDSPRLHQGDRVETVGSKTGEGEPVVQRQERWPFTPRVEGSSPSRFTKRIRSSEEERLALTQRRRGFDSLRIHKLRCPKAGTLALTQRMKVRILPPQPVRCSSRSFGLISDNLAGFGVAPRPRFR